MRALCDTNILVDYANGVEAGGEEISRYDSPMISRLTWMEDMVKTSDVEQDMVRAFLSRFHQLDIDARVAEIAVTIRRRQQMRLLDAGMLASAQTENALLISRNTRDFPVDAPGTRIPYSL